MGAELSPGPATGPVGTAQQAVAGLPAPCGMRGQTALSLGLAKAPRGSPGPASSLRIPRRTRCCHCWGYGWLCAVPLLPGRQQWLSPPSRSPGDTVFSRHVAAAMSLCLLLQGSSHHHRDNQQLSLRSSTRTGAPARAQRHPWGCKLLHGLCGPLQRDSDMNQGTVTSQGSCGHRGPGLSLSCCAHRASRCLWLVPGRLWHLSTGMLYMGTARHWRDMACVPIPAAVSLAQDDPACTCPSPLASAH